MQIRAGGHFRVRPGQPGGASARMIAAHLEREAGTLLLIEPAQHQHAVAERRERLQGLGQLEVGAHGLGRPLAVQVHDPIGDLDERHADRPLRFEGEGRGHGAQHGQGKGGTRPAQEGSAGNGLPSYNHRLPSSFETDCC